MSPVHLPLKPVPQSAMATVKQYAQMNFLHGVSAGWIVPFIVICGLGSLIYFVLD